MIRPAQLLALAFVVCAAPAFGNAKGRIDTLERGQYICEMPGDALGERGVHVPAEDFKITNGSAYVAGGKRGTYLRLSEMVTMTAGPLKGRRYTLKDDTDNARFMRQIGPNGQPTGLRCVKLGG